MSSNRQGDAGDAPCARGRAGGRALCCSYVRRLVALLVSLMLLLPAGSVSAQAFFCNMQGRVPGKCCCGEKPSDEIDAQRSPGDESPRASQAGCCEERTLAASAERRGVSANDDLSHL